MENAIFLVFMLLPVAKCAQPGQFYWSPRLGLDLSIPTTEKISFVHQPSKTNILEGLVVIIDGYQMGVTVIAMASGLSAGEHFPHLNPLSANFYTNVYRWGLRHASLLPLWMGGHAGHYVDTHKTWQRRFYYMDDFMPSWLKKLIPYVKKEEWDQEEREFRRYKKYVEKAFGKHYRYPTKTYDNFKSQTEETVENLDISSNSIEKE